MGLVSMRPRYRELIHIKAPARTADGAQGQGSHFGFFGTTRTKSLSEPFNASIVALSDGSRTRH